MLLPPQQQEVTGKMNRGAGNRVFRVGADTLSNKIGNIFIYMYNQKSLSN
jgi:hypothetical protein